jgi:hypothetical protein
MSDDELPAPDEPLPDEGRVHPARAQGITFTFTVSEDGTSWSIPESSRADGSAEPGDAGDGPTPEPEP